MSEILRDIEAGYAARAQMALEPRGEALERVARPKATRTYTGAALERRRAWGRVWGARAAANAKLLPTELER